MNATIVVATISALAAILVAAFTFWTTKNKEREAEWRKEKFLHYKEYMSALSDTVGSHSHEAKKRYALAFNTVGLFSSQEVITCLHQYQKLTSRSAAEVPLDEHDKLLTELILAIRKDLKLKPKDNAATFSFKLIAPPTE